MFHSHESPSFYSAGLSENLNLTAELPQGSTSPFFSLNTFLLMEDSEECSSSESGWTMYLASPMHEDDDEEEEEGDGEVEDGGAGGEDDKRGRINKDDGDGNGDGDDDDDDSMASDASSGPAASYIGHGKESKVVESKTHRAEAKEEMKKTKSLEKNQDKGGGATSEVRRTMANK